MLRLDSAWIVGVEIDSTVAVSMLARRFEVLSREKRSISSASRAKARLTRMPFRFSSMVVFISASVSWTVR